MPGVMHLVTQCGSSSSVYCTLFCILSALTDLVVMKVMGGKKKDKCACPLQHWKYLDV